MLFFLNGFFEPLSLSLSLFHFLESNNTYSKEGKKKGKKKKRRRQKNNRTKKSLSRTHSFFFVFKNYIRICLNSRPLSPSLYLLLLVYYNDSSSSFPNKHNRVHTTSRDQRRVRSSEEREKKRWTATISCSRRNWPSKRRGAVHVASTRSEAVSEFFFLRVDDAHGQLTFFCRERRFCASRFEGTGRRAKRTRGGDATNRARDDGLRTRAELF